MNLNFSCLDPTHNRSNRNMFHVWRDATGRLHAQECPEYKNAANLDREAAKESRKKRGASWLED